MNKTMTGASKEPMFLNEILRKYSSNLKSLSVCSVFVSLLSLLSSKI